MAKHPPKSLQGYLWSVKIEDLDINKDKNFIIHQILSYGNLKALRWLFNTYKKSEIKNAFLKKAAKIYRPETYNFIKNIILEIKDRKIDSKKYVINTPRSLR